jgi:hypothetical protein
MATKLLAFVAAICTFLVAARAEADDIDVGQNNGVVVNYGTVNNTPREQFAPLLILEDSWEALRALGDRYDEPPKGDSDILDLLPSFWADGNPQSVMHAVRWVRKYWYTVRQIAVRSQDGSPKWRLLIEFPKTVGGYALYFFQGWYNPELDENSLMPLDHKKIPIQKPDLQAYVKVDAYSHLVRWLWSGRMVSAGYPLGL